MIKLIKEVIDVNDFNSIEKTVSDVFLAKDCYISGEGYHSSLIDIKRAYDGLYAPEVTFVLRDGVNCLAFTNNIIGGLKIVSVVSGYAYTGQVAPSASFYDQIAQSK